MAQGAVVLVLVVVLALEGFDKTEPLSVVVRFIPGYLDVLGKVGFEDERSELVRQGF